MEQTELELTRTESLLPEDAQFLTLVRLLALDAGEPAALALMLQRPQAILLTDDAAARLAANQLGMRVHGRSAFCCERCGAVSVRHRKYSPCCALCQSDLQSTLALTR